MEQDYQDITNKIDELKQEYKFHKRRSNFYSVLGAIFIGSGITSSYITLANMEIVHPAIVALTNTIGLGLGIAIGCFSLEAAGDSHSDAVMREIQLDDLYIERDSLEAQLI